MSFAPTPIVTIGRILLGVSTFGLGVLCGAHLADVFTVTPGGDPWSGTRAHAFANAIILTGAGVAFVVEFKVFAAALVLAVLLSSSVLLVYLPQIAVGVFTFEWWAAMAATTALIGAALVLAGYADHERGRWWREGGALLFGASLLAFGFLHLLDAHRVASLVPAWIPYDLFWAYITGIAHAAAGIAILAAVHARPAALLAGAMYGSWALVLHLPPLLVSSGTLAAQNEWKHFLMAVAFCGAAWLVAYAQPAPSRIRRDEVEYPRFDIQFQHTKRAK